MDSQYVVGCVRWVTHRCIYTGGGLQTKSSGWKWEGVSASEPDSIAEYPVHTQSVITPYEPLIPLAETTKNRTTMHDYAQCSVQSNC